MNTQEFLERILPRQGVYYAIPQSSNGKMLAHIACNSIQELASTVTDLDRRYKGVFHACASYKATQVIRNNRTAYRVSENQAFAKSFWLDLDVGEGKGFATKDRALSALHKLCKKFGASPLVVSSGHGLHAYFVMDRDVSAEEWKPVALRLDGLLKHIKFPVDSSRTKDFASILRPVGTYNKKATPLPVEVVEDAGAISFDWFRDRLLNLTKGLKDIKLPNSAPATEEEIALDKGPSDPNVKKLWQTEFVRSFEQKADADLICEKCQQMKRFRDSKGDLSYWAWFAGIGVLKYCKDGEELAKAWSANRVATGHTNTDAGLKWDTWDDEKGPGTCELFAKENSGCEGCPNRGKVKTPYSFGFLSAEELHEEAPASDEQATETETIEASKTSAQAAVEYAQSQGEDPILLPTGFSWTEGLGMMMDANGDKDPVVFAGTYFHIVDRYEDEAQLEQYLFRSVDPKSHKLKEFSFRGGLTASAQKLKEYLGNQGIQTYPKGDNAMVAYIIKSIEQLRNKVSNVKVATTFGWQPNEGTIVLGTKKYEAGKPIAAARLAAKIRAKKALFSEPKGTVDGYVSALNAFYNRPYMEPLQYAICSIWGSLLVELSDPEYNGIPCALTGSKSGIGKTTAVKAAIQAFSSSNDMVIPGFGGATPAARYGRLAMLHSFGMLFDEMTVRGERRLASEKLSDFAYNIAHGFERARSIQVGNEWVAGDSVTWKSQSVITGNTNWLDILNQGNANFDPESMRIFEINTDDYPNIPSLGNPRQVEKWVSQIRNNSGPVGDLFCQYLVDNQDKLRALLFSFYDNHECPNELMDAKFRFYRNHIACTITAAEIMKKLGVIQFDLKALYMFAVEAAQNLIHKSNIRNMDALEKIRSFLTAMAPWTMTTEHYDNGPFEAQAGRQLRAPQDRVIKVRRIYTPANCSRKTTKDAKVLDNTIMLYVKALKNWLTTESQGSYETLRAQLQAAGVLKKGVATKYSLGKGLSDYCTGEQDACLVLDLTKVSPDFFEE